jgi:hypothetical protein
MALMTPSAGQPVPRRCPRCGGDFLCGMHQPATDPCWCAAERLDPALLTRLAAAFDGCLCQDCLRAEADAALTRDRTR